MARKLSGRFEARPIAAINITPMIGVLLAVFAVLTIPAAITIGSSLYQAPMDCFGQCRASDPLFISLRSDGLIFLGEQQVDESELMQLLASHDPARASLGVRADAEVPYSRMFQVMRKIKAAGFKPYSINEDLH